MKKTIALIGCLLLSSVFLFGCGFGNAFGCGGTTVEPILSAKPWTNANGYEYISYGVTRYKTVLTEDGNNYTYGDKIAEGNYTNTLVTIKGNIYDSPEFEKLKARSEYFADALADVGNKKLSTAAGAYSVLYTDYELTFNDKSDYAGKTDRQSSVLVFKTSSLLPVFSEKKTAYTASAHNYTATADYTAHKNIFTSEETGRVETKLRDEETAYDNELLYYIIRSHSSLAAGGSASIATRNSVYTGINNGEDYRNMAFQVASENGVEYNVSGIDPEKNGFMSRYFKAGDVVYNAEDKKNDSGNYEYYKGYALPVYYVNLQYNNADHGPAKLLYYSKTDFNYIGENTSRVMLQSIDFETDQEGTLAYATVSLINDYKVSTLM